MFWILGSWSRGKMTSISMLHCWCPKPILWQALSYVLDSRFVMSSVVASVFLEYPGVAPESFDCITAGLRRLWDLYWSYRLSSRRSHKPRRDGRGLKFFLVCKAASWRSLIILFLVVLSGAEAAYRSWQQWFGSRMVPRGSCCRCAGSQWTFCVSLSSMAGQERGRWQNRERASSR